jgi:hypothetical protein
MRVEARTLIDAPPDLVAALYADFTRWPEVFPLIHGVRLLRREHGKLVIEVRHQEGLVINELTVRSPTELGLWESKRRYDAEFENRFAAVPQGTLLAVVGVIELKGWARLLDPFAARIARRRMVRFQLQPLKEAAEREIRSER